MEGTESPEKEINIKNEEMNENVTLQNNNDDQESLPKIERKASRSNSRIKTKKMSYKQMMRDQKIGELKKSSTINNSYHDHYQQEGWRQRMQKFVQSTPFTITMSIVTIYALFGDDIRVVSTTKDADPYFWGISTVCLAAFGIEIILQSISVPGYFFGFFFWLDVMSTLSLVLDIGWISNLIFQTGKGSASSVASLAKASRASRVGTRAGRIVRVVRLIRLVRLYKHAQQAFAKQAKKFEEEQKKLMEEQRRLQQENASDSAASINNLDGKVGSSPNQKARSSLRKNRTPQQTIMQNGLGSNSRFIPGENGEADPKYQQRNSLKQGETDKKRTKTVLQKQVIDEKTNTVVPVGSNKITPMPVQNDASSKVKSNSQNNLDKSFNLEEGGVELKHGRRQASMSRDRASSLNPSMSINASSHQMSSSNSSTKGEKLAMQTETKVGKTLSDMTIKRVITITILIMFSIPIFDDSTYTDSPTSWQGGLGLVYQNQGQSTFSNALATYISFSSNQYRPMIRLDINSVEQYPLNTPGVPSYLNLRTDDLTYYTYNDINGNMYAVAIVSSVDSNTVDGYLSIARTIFVATVLTFACIKFTADVEKFILEPIEKMLEKVKRISANPLEAATMEEKEAFVIQQFEEEGNLEELAKIKETEKYETVVLEKLIIRIGALLAVGFGEAGSEIIAKNMSSNGVVDPMLPGNKIMAIFGFCDIRNFTDATEVLQTGVMIFVNEIAQITHSTVDQYLGQANKNIGDAFLLVWKFRKQDYLKNEDGSVEFLKNDITSNYADCSVISFLKIMAGITLSLKLKKYKQHPGLQARMKGYRVKMGFGLHFGWSIEGAIGSDYKIDASYLSPNVNMASRLEAATKQFGTGLLISGQLKDILSEKLQSNLRKIDCVTVKGSIVPLDLYTCDVNLERLYDKRKGKDPFDTSMFSSSQLKKKKIMDKMKRNQLKISVFKGTTKPSDEFDSNPDLKEMRKEYTKDFYQLWERAYKHYHDGKWVEAGQLLKQTLLYFQFRQDGPSQTLYEFIKESTFIAPKDWKGFRVLTEK